jgi:hypothetical protein
MKGRVAPLWLFCVVAVVTTGALIHNTRARVASLSNLEYARWVDGQVYSMASWRFWDDMYVGISRYLDWTEGPKRRYGDLDRDIAAFQNLLLEKTGRAGIRHTQFWRTIDAAPFLRVRHKTWIPPLEDPGRPLLLAASFTLMQGIAPYLLLWIGTVASLPALLWVLWEARAAGVLVAGALFVALCVSSPFVVESLSLAHSAVGFYLIAVFVLAALGLYAFLGSDRSVRGFVLRAVAASLVFVVCCTCRASTLALAPGFGVALFAALQRVAPRTAGGGWIRRCLLAGLATAIFVSPYFALRPAQQHNFWMSFWESLGDYGADRGYSWHDRDLKRWLAANGRKPFEHPRYITSDDEVFIREAVLRDIRANPLWLASILGRRFVDTVSLAKLAPYGPRDGFSVRPPPLHYKYTTPVDWFGFGNWKVEVPTALLWAGTLVMLLWWAVAAGRSSPESKRHLEEMLLPVLTLAAATLALPVLLTTAGGMETQAFALAHFLGLSLLVQWTWHRHDLRSGRQVDAVPRTG